METDQLSSIITVIASYPQIKLAYLFGSQATGNTGPMSDYDLAFYIDGLSDKERFNLKINLMTALSGVLKTDAVDIVIINDIDKPELAYDIVREGILLYEREPYKLLIEPMILSKYFDFHTMLKRDGLTRIP